MSHCKQPEASPVVWVLVAGVAGARGVGGGGASAKLAMGSARIVLATGAAAATLPMGPDWTALADGRPAKVSPAEPLGFSLALVCHKLLPTKMRFAEACKIICTCNINLPS